MAQPQIHTQITPRTKLDFGLDGDIPKYWLGGDPFRTRFIDGLSMTFPVGERFFIDSVRRFRDQIQDPQLKQEVRDFMLQEGQHGMVLNQWNARLREQGVPVDAAEAFCQKFFDWQFRWLPKTWPLAHTAAVEHMTALMAEALFGQENFFEGADERMRAVFTWHAIEEFEHKAVAFDVLTKVAKASYFTRVGVMLCSVTMFQLFTLNFVRHILKGDGFSWKERLRIWGSGLWWLYKPRGGLFTRMLPSILMYLKPGFHPSDIHEPEVYRTWNAAFASTQDPLEASRATLQAA